MKEFTTDTNRKVKEAIDSMYYRIFSLHTTFNPKITQEIKDKVAIDTRNNIYSDSWIYINEEVKKESK